MATSAATLPPRPAVRPITRRDTPERWQAAAKRAAAEGVTVRQLAGSGAWIATSGSDITIAYEVTPWHCECRAGEFDDPICKHRATLRVRLGWLTVEPDPEPPAAAVPIRQPEQPCASCHGYGWGYGTVSGGRTDRLTCWICDGTGVEPDTLIVA